MARGQAFGLSATARLALVQRLARRREGQEAQAAADTRGFGSIQNLKDWELVRDAMDALSIQSPFFRTHEGRAGAHTQVGNRDLINFGSTAAKGNTMLTIGGGFRSKLLECLEFGAAYEAGVIDPVGIFDSRVTMDFIWHF